MDPVTGLPPVGPLGCNAVLAVSDRTSRRLRLIPCHTTSDTQELALLFTQHVVSQHGMPEAIISDRDPKFTSDFWRSLHKILGVRLAFSTAHHAQMDGLAERSIGTLEESL
jgi:transposase InsO family protein